MSARRIDKETLKQLLAPHALRILEARGLEAVGNRDAAEVQIRNRSPKRVAGKGRGDQEPSASWNAAKGLLKDFVDDRFNGDLIRVVEFCDGIPFIDAATRAAEEAGIELPMMQSSSSDKGNRPAGPDRPAPTDRADRARDDKIAVARRIWAEAAPYRDSCSESYLEERGIVLERDEPWLRSNDAADYFGRPRSPGQRPAKIATMPALVAALTVAGAGEPAAVVRIFFGHTDDGTVTVKPRIVDPETGREFKNKPVRGSKAGAGVFVGAHLLADTLVVAEGLEDALSAVMAGYAAVAKLSTDLGDLKLPPQVKRIILTADNDGPGAAGFAKAAPIYLARDYEVFAPSMPDGIKDLNELLTARGLDGVRCVLDEAEPWRPTPDDETEASASAESAASTTEPGQAERLIERADDVVVQSNDYLIKGVIGRGATGLIYGPSTVGKTFVALRIASHISTGASFGRHKVRRSPVLYVGLEGQAELNKRLAALCHRAGRHGDFLWRLCAQPLLRRGDDGDSGEAQLLAAAQQLAEAAGEPVGLIVIDTLWRAMAGDDENDAAAIGHLLARVAKIQLLTRAVVLLVHHTGKDPGRGPRGSSALMSAVDFQFLLEANSTGRTLTIEKNKDGPDGAVIPYRLDLVQLGTDDEGDLITSCVAEFDFDGPRTAKSSRKPPRQGTAMARALEELRELVGAGRCIKSHSIDRIPEGVDLVKMDAWRQACSDKRLAPGATKPGSEERAFRRACQDLVTAGLIGVAGDWAWLIDP